MRQDIDSKVGGILKFVMLSRKSCKSLFIFLSSLSALAQLTFVVVSCEAGGRQAVNNRHFAYSSIKPTNGYFPILSTVKELGLGYRWDSELGILTIFSEKGKIILMPGSRQIVAISDVITTRTSPFFEDGVLMVGEEVVGSLLSLCSDSWPYSGNADHTVDLSGSSDGATSGRVDALFRTIVIDPGHGGEDGGAVSPFGIQEKHLVLKIAREVKALIEEKIGVRVLLTRSGDYFVPLEERTAIAANAEADLFISIHANSTKKKSIKGVETFFMSLEASDGDALAAAEMENSVIRLEGKPFAANSDLAVILMDMAQTEYLKESSAFAKVLHKNIVSVLESPDRGVKQAPFMVLASASMPAVLIEVGFISNPFEVRMLADESTHRKIAKAILRSVEKFKERMEIKLSSKF